MSESEQVACPYCNSRFPRPASADTGYWQCPRCGDHFPAGSAAPTTPTSPSPAPRAVAETPPLVCSTRRTAGLLLGLMLGMALLGLFYALYTQPWRRSLDQKLPGADSRQIPPADSLPLPLAHLSSWGYLPHTSQLVLALQLAALRHEPAGKALCERLHTSYRIAWQSIEEKTGLKWDDLDHLLLALYPPADSPHRLLLVVQSQQPLTPFLCAQPLPRPQDYRGRPVYHWALEPWGEVWLWQVAENTLLLNLGLLPATLQVWEDIPAPQDKSHSRPTTLPPRLLPAFRKLPHQNHLTLLASGTAWEALRDLGVRPPGAKKAWERLTSLSSLGLGITATGTQLTLLAALQTGDPISTQHWRSFLEQQQNHLPELRLVGPDPDDQGGFWTQFQARGSAVDLVDLLLACFPLPQSDR